MELRTLTAICFALLLCVLFFLQFSCSPTEECIIPGFWIATDKFKEKSNLDQLIMYFDEGSGYDYQGYIIMNADGKTIYNDTIRFRIIPKSYFKREEYSIEMSEQVGIMPKKLTMNISISTGKMIIKCLNEKKVFAELYKDNQMTSEVALNIGSKVAEGSDEEDV